MLWLLAVCVIVSGIIVKQIWRSSSTDNCNVERLKWQARYASGRRTMISHILYSVYLLSSMF